jgi:hypothetical protein
MLSLQICFDRLHKISLMSVLSNDWKDLGFNGPRCLVRHLMKSPSQTPLFAHRETACECPSDCRNARADRATAPGAELPTHPLDKKPVAQPAIASDIAGTARQQMFDSHKLVVPQPITSHPSLPKRRLPMNHALPDLRIPYLRTRSAVVHQ